MRATFWIGLIVGAASLLACEADTTRPTIEGTPTFKSLTTREAVLNNLEVSYNKRNLTRYDELLDPDFTFFLAPGDVGGSIPVQWARADEMAITTLLFDATLDDARYPTCRSIRMNLDFEDGVDWIDLIPPAFPTETWYTTTVFYDFIFEMKPDNTYIAVPGSSAQFTVRNAGTENAPQWRLVEFRDLGYGSLLAHAPSRTDQGSTWGVIKALYR